SHEQGHRAWYAHSAGRQLSPPGGLGSEYPTLDLINKANPGLYFRRASKIWCRDLHPGYLKGDNDASASFLLSFAQPHP
ncbi:hypothetical protein Q5469_13655, partial [Escherichia coli]|nr:hypothetical protein [Escherichia coli]